MIPEFYNGREIFITGGSGVVGKALIEKLLRSCNVKKLYILLRPKKNRGIDDRLEDLRQEMIFRRLRKEKPNEFIEKVIAIPGDVLQPMLGISPENIARMSNVSLIYHSAATIRFDEPFKDAVNLNVGGTLEALRFAETLKNLEVFMHVSTYYSNPYLEFVEPKLYRPPMNWKFCLDLVRRKDLPDEMLDVLTRKLIMGFPNTYCFTKNLGESLVNEYRHKLPVVIYRPSIVIFSVEEPEQGFPTNFAGIMGLFALCATGMLKIIHSPLDQILDFSPQDITVKSMAYYTLKASAIYAKGKPDEVPIFHTSMVRHVPLTYTKTVGLSMDLKFYEHAVLEKNFLIPGVQFTESRIWYIIMVWLKQIIPAMIGDLLLRLSGRKPFMMFVQRKVYHVLKVFEPFTFNMYYSDGITYYEEMLEVLKNTDFQINFITIADHIGSHVELCRSMVYGIREIMFKEDPATLPKARRILLIKKIIYRLFQIWLLYKLYLMLVPRLLNWKWHGVDGVDQIIN